MLLPALSQARNRAKAIQCTGNLKQIGTALGMYISDNSEYIVVREDYYGTRTGHSSNYQAWTFFLFPYLGQSARMDADLKSASGSTHRLSASLPNVFLCPSVNFSICTKTNMSHHPSYTAFVGPLKKRIGQIPAPSRSMILGDNSAGIVQGESSHYKSAAGAGMVRGSHQIPTAGEYLYTRHQKRCNTLFIGGNVQALSFNAINAGWEHLPYGCSYDSSITADGGSYGPERYSYLSNPLSNEHF